MIIKGRTVILYTKRETGRDAFNAPIYAMTPESIDNVLVEPASTDDIITTTQLYGKKIAYTLHIPRTDNHIWVDSIVEFYGRKYRTFGDVLEYDPNLTPLEWGRKIKCELYGG